MPWDCHGAERGVLRLYQALRGPILYSFLDLDNLKRPQSFEDAVKNGGFKCNWVEESYPTGALDPPVGVVAAPTGSFGILVCKVAAGATLVHQQADGKMQISNPNVFWLNCSDAALSSRQTVYSKAEEIRVYARDVCANGFPDDFGLPVPQV